MQSSNQITHRNQANKKRKNNFLVQGSILAAASLLSRIIGLLYRVPLTRIIDDEGMGIYSTAFYIYNLGLIVSSYSIPLAVSKLVSARNVKKEYKNAYRIFLCALVLSTIMGLMVGLILFFGADIIAGIFGEKDLSIPLRVLAPTIFVFSIMGVLRGFFQGKNTMLPTSISQLLEQVVNAGVSLWAALWLTRKFSASESISAYGAAGATLGTLMGTVVSLLFLAFIFSLYKPILYKQFKKDSNESHESKEELIAALAVTCIPVIIGQVVYQLNGVLDSALFYRILGGKGIDKDSINNLWGIYSNKYNLLINVPVSIASAMSVAVIPNIASSLALRNMKDVKKKVNQTIKFNMLIAIPAAVGMAVLASPILRLLFGDGREYPASLLRYGSIAIVFYALSTITNGVLQGINRMRIPVRNSAISLVIHLIIVFVLLKYTDLELYAMVIANVSFAFVVCILNWMAVGKYLKYRQEIRTTFLMPILCSIVMGIVTYFSYEGVHMIIPSNIIATLISILLSCITYGLMLVLTKTIREEELREMPMGTKLLSIFKKLRLL